MIASPDALVEQATSTTDLSDFGADGWQLGLERLVDAVSVDLDDDEAIVRTIETTIVRRLVKRLHIERWYAEHGADAATPVEGPVVIVGLPRTATTALQYLLAVDPQFRYPRNWELASPLPPPELATERDDPRRPQGAGRSGDVRHISAPDGPAEDGPLHALDFHHQEFGLPVPTFTTWWRTADQTTAFAYYDRVLRLLHSRRPPYRWLVKCPAHLFHLPELSAQYPNAKFLMTHRDPAAAVPSACSVILDARQRVLPGWSADLAALGREVQDHFAEGVQRAGASRAAIGEDRFIDIAQREVEADAVTTAERIYEFLGLDLSAEVRAAMEQWAVDNRRGSRGEHHYSPEDFGLTADGIRDAYAGYLSTYGSFAGTAGV
jgi:hypothetical protein